MLLLSYRSMPLSVHVDRSAINMVVALAVYMEGVPRGVY